MTYTEQNELPFSIKPRELIIATVAAFSVYFALFGVGFQSDASDVVAATTKADRLPLAGEPTCAGQAWGNWNKQCLEALAGRDNLRLVPTHTVEVRDENRRLSILIREPSRS